MKRLKTFILLLSLAANSIYAGDLLNLNDITRGTFRPQTMGEIEKCSDGENFIQISPDAQRIEMYSFKTGALTQTLIDLKTVRGDKVNRIDGYIMSPDGKRMLIQTATQYIYRRSFKANYYIWHTFIICFF